MVRHMGTADIGTLIPSQTKPTQAFDKFTFRTWLVTFLVGVFNTQDELTACLTG
jgi:hypothetical protein